MRCSYKHCSSPVLPCSDVYETAFLSKVPYYSNNLPLPKKLMIRIFEYYVNLSGEGPRQMETLAEVCESWRQLILESEGIWKRSRVIIVSQAILRLPHIKKMRSHYKYLYQVTVKKMDHDTIEKLIKLGVVFKFLDPHSGLELVKVDSMEESFNLVFVQPNPDWFKEQMTERLYTTHTLKIDFIHELEYPTYVEKRGSNLTVLEIYYAHEFKHIDFLLLMENTPNLVKFDYTGPLNIQRDFTLHYYRDNPNKHRWKKLEFLSIESDRGTSEVASFLSGGGGKLRHLQLDSIITDNYHTLRSKKWRKRKIRSLHLKKINQTPSNIPIIIDQWSDSLESLHVDREYYYDCDYVTSLLKAVSNSKTNKIIKEVELNLPKDFELHQKLFDLYQQVQSLCRTNRLFS